MEHIEEHVHFRLTQHAYFGVPELAEAAETLQLRQREAHGPELSYIEIDEIVLLAVEVAAVDRAYTLTTAALAVLAWRNFEWGLTGQ